MRKENKKVYRQLRECGVPFVDAHRIAQLMLRDTLKAYAFASKCPWAKPGESDMGCYPAHEEVWGYSSVVLPNGFSLVSHSHDGVYVAPFP